MKIKERAAILQQPYLDSYGFLSDFESGLFCGASRLLRRIPPAVQGFVHFSHIMSGGSILNDPHCCKNENKNTKVT